MIKFGLTTKFETGKFGLTTKFDPIYRRTNVDRRTIFGATYLLNLRTIDGHRTRVFWGYAPSGDNYGMTTIGRGLLRITTWTQPRTPYPQLSRDHRQPLQGIVITESTYVRVKATDSPSKSEKPTIGH